jgi:hypothetical protein
MPQFLKDMAKTVAPTKGTLGSGHQRAEMGGFSKRKPDPGIFGNKRELTRQKLKQAIKTAPRQFAKQDRMERAERLLLNEEMGRTVTHWEVHKKIKTLKMIAKRRSISPVRKKGIQKDIQFLQAIKGQKNEE